MNKYNVPICNLEGWKDKDKRKIKRALSIGQEEKRTPTLNVGKVYTIVHPKNARRFYFILVPS